MKKTLCIFLMMLLVTGAAIATSAGDIKPKKCKTCGESVTLCPYKGSHPKPNTKPKQPEKKQKEKKQAEPKRETKPKPKQVTPTGYDVTISCNAGSEATLYIDGTNYGKPGTSHYLKTGSHSVIITADGYVDFYKIISVDKNNTRFSSSMAEKDAEGLCQLGKNYLNGESGYSKDYDKAAKWFRRAADKGNAEAQNWLGRCYAEGWGVTKSDTEAAKWFRKAADQGNIHGQYNMGMCYYYGEGVPQNYHDAVKWFRLAANQGNASSQYMLGRCYEKGCGGLEKSNYEAIKCYRKAADSGNENAKKALKQLESSSGTSNSSVTRIVRTDLKD